MNSPKKSARLEQQFEIKLDKFQKQLKRFIENPDPDAIHDVRTTYRRLEACYGLFPRSRRNARSEKYLRFGKKFFAASSQIRDADIMADKFARLMAEQTVHQDDARQLLLGLGSQRTAQLTSAMRLARHLDRLPQPHLKSSHRLLKQRLRKLVQRHSNTILQGMPHILATQGDSDEIHSMRKQVKKLCYLIELIMPSDKHQGLSQLKQIQTLAGTIHDCDVTIEYLNDCSSRAPGSVNLAKIEMAYRHGQYVKLVKQLGQLNWPKVMIKA